MCVETDEQIDKRKRKSDKLLYTLQIDVLLIICEQNINYQMLLTISYMDICINTNYKKKQQNV